MNDSDIEAMALAVHNHIWIACGQASVAVLDGGEGDAEIKGICRAALSAYLTRHAGEADLMERMASAIECGKAYVVCAIVETPDTYDVLRRTMDADLAKIDAVLADYQAMKEGRG